jgi:hypothetical protein
MIPLLMTVLLAADPQPAALAKSDWDCHIDGHFRVCAASGRDTASLVAQAEKGFRGALRFIGASQYPHEIYLFVVGSPREMQWLIHAYANGASHPEEHAVFVVEGHAGELAHELNHEVVTGLWGKSEFWIAEGLAAYATDPNGIDERCRKAFEERWSLKLQDMVKPGWNAAQDPYPARAIYPMLGSFVKYLKAAYGMAAIRKVWTKGSASISAIFGKSLDELDRDWRTSLNQPPIPRAFLRYTTLEARTVQCAGGPKWSEGAHNEFPGETDSTRNE